MNCTFLFCLFLAGFLVRSASVGGVFGCRKCTGCSRVFLVRLIFCLVGGSGSFSLKRYAYSANVIAAIVSPPGKEGPLIAVDTLYSLPLGVTLLKASPSPHAHAHAGTRQVTVGTIIAALYPQPAVRVSRTWTLSHARVKPCVAHGSSNER